MPATEFIMLVTMPVTSPHPLPTEEAVKRCLEEEFSLPGSPINVKIRQLWRDEEGRRI